MAAAEEDPVPDPNELLAVVLCVDGMRRGDAGTVLVDLGGEQNLAIRLLDSDAKRLCIGRYVRLTLTLEPEDEP